MDKNVSYCRPDVSKKECQFDEATRSKRNCSNRSCQGDWHFVRTVSCFQHFSTKNIKEQFKQVTRWETKTTPRWSKMFMIYDVFFWNIFIPFWDWFIVFQCFFRLFDIILACGKSFFFGQPAPGWRWMTRHFHSVEKSIGVFHQGAIQFLVKKWWLNSWLRTSGFFRWWIHMKACRRSPVCAQPWAMEVSDVWCTVRARPAPDPYRWATIQGVSGIFIFFFSRENLWALTLTLNFSEIIINGQLIENRMRS